MLAKGPIPEAPPSAARDRHPRLRALVDRVASSTGAPQPDLLWFVADVNAAVLDVEARRGRSGAIPDRALVLGVGLLSVLDVEQLAAIIAHELQHLEADDTASAPGRASKVKVLSLVGSLFRPLAGVAARGIERAQQGSKEAELAADAAAVKAMGKQAVSESLVRSTMAGSMWRLFVEREVHPVVQTGHFPSPVFEGFRWFLDESGRGGLGQLVGDAVLAAPANPLDSHPAMKERLAHVAALPAPAKTVKLDDLRAPGTKARDLLDDANAVESEVAAWWQRQLSPKPLSPIAWDDVGERVVRPLLQQRAEALATMIDLETLLAAVGQGREASVARSLFPMLARAPEPVLLEHLFAAAGQLLCARWMQEGSLRTRPGAELEVRGGPQGPDQVRRPMSAAKQAILDGERRRRLVLELRAGAARRAAASR